VLIDWFTVGAQIVNFLVLMVLLKIFLYDRVIQAMDDREQNIASRLQKAEQERQTAKNRQKKLEEKEKQLDQKRDKLLTEAREAARSKREELEQKARSEVDALRDRWTEALEQEKDNFARDLQRTAMQQALAVSRRVIRDMAGEDFQVRLVDTFTERIRAMDAEEKGKLVEGLDEKDTAAVVLSGSEVSSSQRKKITRLVHEEIHRELDVDYRTDSNLLGGIELRIHGRKIAWNPQEYLDELEEHVLQALEEASEEEETVEDDGGREKEKKESD
jgi:F-type H+-transporting ATPase subunit b